jgi:hypothetical protein
MCGSLAVLNGYQSEADGRCDGCRAPLDGLEHTLAVVVGGGDGCGFAGVVAALDIDSG